MAFLTLSKNHRENRIILGALIEDVYKNGSGTRHIENKKCGNEGYKIISIYGGGFERGKDNPVFDHNESCWPLPVTVEFGQCDFKKKYNPISTLDKFYRQKYLIEQIASEVIAWLFSNEPQVGDCYETEINQGIRDCEVVKVGRTRIRVEYEMPNAGMMGGYHPILNLFGRKLYYNPRH
tara:strand:- start:166 stop:702 length:537 start_codon:yes stop_codon:yes gene_type:complete